MEPASRSRAIVTALYVNAALLGGVLLVLLARGGGGGLSLATPAFAAQPQMPPVAGGNGVYLMPAQFSMNIWGCYLLDTDKQTMCAYQFLPGEKQLRFIAAREFREDMGIKRWNTSPDPAEVKRLVDLQAAPVRGKAPVPPGSPQDPVPESPDRPRE